MGEIHGGLIGVNVSRTITSQFIRLLGQFQASLFRFTKRSRTLKTHHKQKSTNKTKISEQKTTNTTIFCAHKNF